MIRSSDRRLTFGSLFAGIGGIDLGFERAGMTCKWQVEIDDYATRVLAKHWPGVPKWRDVRTFPPDDRGCGVDVITAGAPCQDISYAGRGAGLDGERSGLFWEVVRIVRDLGPKYVFLENVPALLTRGLDDVLGSLASLGYDAEWHCVQAADFGAPHIRDRVYVIAEHVSDATDKGSRRRGEQPESREETWNVANTNGTREPQPQGRVSKIRRRPSNCGWWDTEPDVVRVANGFPRRLGRIRGLGNAVPPPVAEYFARQIVAMHARH